MLLTVTTVKDSPANVRRFVAGNLAGGVDHLVVLLDDPAAPGQDEVAAELTAHPHVTCLTGDREWWAGDRPKSLNVRQRITANLVAAAAARLGWVDWLVHLDGDEVADLDRAALDALPDTVGAVRLTVLESVSQLTATEPPTLFKRLLEPEELNLLHVLGVIREPTNQSYFHGHVMGKAAIRPAAGLRLTLHHAVDARGRQVEPHLGEGQSVLHYDAWSGEEFIRKWTAMLGAGPVRYRADRGTTASALRTLVGLDLSPELARDYLTRIYQQTTADDVPTLADLGLLVAVDPAAGGHRPAELTDVRRQELADALARAAAQDKRSYDVPTGRPGAAEPAGRGRRSRLGRQKG